VLSSEAMKQQHSRLSSKEKAGGSRSLKLFRSCSNKVFWLAARKLWMMRCRVVQIYFFVAVVVVVVVVLRHKGGVAS
jgi:hypothetical protein